MQEGFICLKQYINHKDYEDINKLQDICKEYDNVNLKLEVDYKLNVRKSVDSIKTVNEFLYYIDDTLVGYLGICSFGGNTAELNGLVNPYYRRKGIFTTLYSLALEECKRRNFDRILLVCDDKAEPGKEFIKSVDASYAFSEYQMRAENIEGEKSAEVNLRKAERLDAREIARQNAVYFGSAGSETEIPEDVELDPDTYMIELAGKTIGKIKIGLHTSEDIGDIYGFGIIPEYRRKGYGRQSLNSALYIIRSNGCSNAFLEVASKNSNALNLYKSCGFVEQSTMNYYNHQK
jgi:ribosomal protein S18 acetylase RimI-like enzyme